MPTSWATITGALLEEKASTAVITCLTTHALLLHGTPAIAPAKTAQALVAQTGRQNNGSRPVCSNPNCGWTGHTADKCFCKGGGLEGQFPDWWKKSKGTPTIQANSNTTPSPNNAAPQANLTLTSATNSDNPKCLVFSTLTCGVPKNGQTTYADSAASQHFFVDRADFARYGPPDSNSRTGLAANRPFKVVGCGKV